MLKKTKIVASISDLRCYADFVRDLTNAGMNVVRMNNARREGSDVAVCHREKTMRHPTLSYGVEVISMPEKAGGQAYYFAALQKMPDDGVLPENETETYLSGDKKGTQTSFPGINVVEEVLKHAMVRAAQPSMLSLISTGICRKRTVWTNISSNISTRKANI